jgi:hypothetical protein
MPPALPWVCELSSGGRVREGSRRKLNAQPLSPSHPPPLPLSQPYKIGDFSRLAFERKLAVVVVGAPAVPLFYPRVRFCISAAHSRADLTMALQVRDIHHLACSRLVRWLWVLWGCGVERSNPHPPHAGGGGGGGSAVAAVPACSCCAVGTRGHAAGGVQAAREDGGSLRQESGRQA